MIDKESQFAKIENIDAGSDPFVEIISLRAKLGVLEISQPNNDAIQKLIKIADQLSEKAINTTETIEKETLTSLISNLETQIKKIENT